MSIRTALIPFLLIAFLVIPEQLAAQDDFNLYGNPGKSGKRKKKKSKKKKKKGDYDPYEFLYENLDKGESSSGEVKSKEDIVNTQNENYQTVDAPTPAVGFPSSNGDGEVIEMNVDDLWHSTLDTVVVRSQRKELSFHDQENVKYYYSQALQKIDGQSYESAIKLLNKSLKKDPNSKELLQIRANAYVEVGEYRKAIRDFKKVLIIAPNDPIANYNMASSNAKIGKFEEAIKYYSIAIREKNDYLLAYQGRASAKTMMKDYESSITDYNNAIDINAFFTPAYRGRGVAKSMQGYTDQAIMDFTYTIDLTPEDGLTYYYRGLAFSQNRDYVQACEDFIEAYKRNVQEATYELKELCNFGDFR